VLIWEICFVISHSSAFHRCICV